VTAASTRLFLAILLVGPFAGIASTDDSTTQLSSDVTVRQLAPNVWIHTSIQRYAGGVIVPSNGLIDETDHGSILIDTAWNDQQTQRICDWAATTLQNPVRLAIVTHAHNDRIGGVGFLLSKSIPVMGLKMTADIAKARKLIGPTSLFDLNAGETKQVEGLELFYPGSGHAPDNIVVWLPSERILFGGCLIKSADAGNLGFVGDADLKHWPLAVNAVKDRYAAATIVVPGHGTPGDGKLLIHTLELLSAADSTTRPSNPELLH
jgi:metallo-beta-lactamase class B